MTPGLAPATPPATGDLPKTRRSGDRVFGPPAETLFPLEPWTRLSPHQQTYPNLAGHAPDSPRRAARMNRPQSSPIGRRSVLVR